MRAYFAFNILCLLLSGAFAAGILWQWKFMIDQWLRQKPVQEVVVSVEDFEKKEQGSSNETIEQKNDSEKNETVSSTKSIEQESSSDETSQESETTVLTQAYNELQGVHEGVMINLDVPYTSQAPERNWDQPWQDACEEVSLLMLDAYYKGYGLSPLYVKDEVQKMVAWEEKKGWGGSIEIEKVKEVYEQMFGGTKQVRIIQNPTIAQIESFIDNGDPVLAVGDGTVLPNQWYTDGGPEYHAFIIRGYTQDGFITNDPGVNRGKNFLFPKTKVMQSLHDWNGGNVSSGVAAILVLE